MESAGACAFCEARVEREFLWRGERYGILPDAYPRCAGHLLLVTREHLPSHMHAPEAWLPEFHVAQEKIRRFLSEVYGAASFYENGGARQEVPHAHLHGLPFQPTLPEGWEGQGYVELIRGWDDARKEVEALGHYFYLETAGGCFLIRKYGKVLRHVRGQLARQTLGWEPGGGPRRKPPRGGEELVEATVAAWRRWTATDPAS